MSDPRDYKLDLSSLEGAGETPASGDKAPGTGGANADRPFLRVLFRCCNMYVRVYRRPEDTGYHAVCPKCAKSVRFQVASGGTAARDFVVD